MLKTARPLLAKLGTGLAISALALAVSACGSTKWGFPYRADVQQGNWITAEQVARLEQGMSREQVRFILGTPTLQDVFHSQRWDYTYYNKPGYGKAEARRFTVWFDGDILTRWEGDEQPDRQPFQQPAPLSQTENADERPVGADQNGSDTAETTGAESAPAEIQLNAPQPPLAPGATPNDPSPEPLR